MRRERSQTGTDVTPGVVYQTFGEVPSSARIEAESMMKSLSEVAPRPVLYSRVKIRVDDDRNPDQGAIAQATMDVSGAVLRAQAAGPDAVTAIRSMGNRLERRINRLAGRRQRAEKRPRSTPRNSWRSGDAPDDSRPEFYDRPSELRRVVRHKTYSPAERISISEAVFDLDVLDYRFFLFTDESDGLESVVYEADGGEIIVRKVDGSAPAEDSIAPHVSVNETPAPRIGIDEAVARLNVTDMPFIFFVHVASGDAGVLYRRYDGHYGLISPS